ncbi:multiubiquitin [Amycolatopsis thermoflava]|uniref:Multiubiquitin n=1 Tax=Amycolatopsis thermoflava TaxID=84480 RepID=A0A3N2GPE4_9PSEU|nr:multiubiquitin [Amycolatopsis thermoflava]
MTTEAVADRTKHHEVIVNGRTRVVTSSELTFDEVVGLAYDPVPSGPNWVSPSHSAAGVGTSRREPSGPAKPSRSRKG